MKIVFLDTEFTGLHANPTLISLALVTLSGEEKYVVLNDFNREQVSDWVRDHVLSTVDMNVAVSSKEACVQVDSFLRRYGHDDRVTIVSAGKMSDFILFFELWHSLKPEKKYFHFVDDMPDYIAHWEHIDLNTMFLLAGLDPSMNRAEFADFKSAVRHNALDDARVVRLCFLKLLSLGHFPILAKRIGNQGDLIAS